MHTLSGEGSLGQGVGTGIEASTRSNTRQETNTSEQETRGETERKHLLAAAKDLLDRTLRPPLCTVAQIFSTSVQHVGAVSGWMQWGSDGIGQPGRVCRYRTYTLGC